MSIKDNLEKAASIFGDSHEPECVAMTEETKAKILKDGKEQMHEAIADMFERNPVVTKKPFDISDHEWNKQGDIIIHVYSDGEISFDAGDSFVVIRKQDAIAIAKALGVIGEDLLS